MIFIDNEFGIVTVKGRAGRTVTAAIEDFRAAVDESELTLSMRESIDELDFNPAADKCFLINTAKMPKIDTPHHLDVNTNEMQQN